MVIPPTAHYDVSDSDFNEDGQIDSMMISVYDGENPVLELVRRPVAFWDDIQVGQIHGQWVYGVTAYTENLDGANFEEVWQTVASAAITHGYNNYLTAEGAQATFEATAVPTPSAGLDVTADLDEGISQIVVLIMIVVASMVVVIAAHHGIKWLTRMG